MPNGLIVGCEALFVPYTPGGAWALFAAGAVGMAVGDVTAGRLLSPAARARAVTPLRLLLAAPFALFLLQPPLALAALVVAVASVGFGAGLLVQERLLALTPAERHGQALGLHSAGMLTCQALGATLAGAVASALSPTTTMALLAVASTAVTLSGARALGRTPERALPERAPENAPAPDGPAPESAPGPDGPAPENAPALDGDAAPHSAGT
ncbi:hypothetical protein FH609_019395 [Streptomyces sp. 3MP-14]|uniref:MFS transporter n=1 Tax=Streptomyces mimosae TaxID=2586635 RepID=A0A5N6A8L6_9ACTN|nr:hypothetical protein FH607_017935 [Streptomyces mimosae]KAB8175261.1 hypothetical protein FH609_019395 [Streptomyces sp. 3MP-14]